MTGCVYLIRSPTGKGYVGLTKHNAETRWRVHRAEHRSSTWSALHAAMRKHGPETFSLETLYESSVWEELLAAECRLIEELGTRAPDGYNLTAGGEGCRDFDPELLAQRNLKIAEAARLRWQDPAYRARVRTVQGMKHSPEARAKMSEAARRRWQRG